MNIIAKLAEELKFSEEHITRAVEMLDEGNTVPFIARYRKEVTGSMDDDTLRTLEDRLRYLRNLDERRAEIISSIEGQEKMTPELLAAIEKAETQVALEDLYLPYRPKRKTRASVARERGLEPLAALVTAEPEKLEESLETLAEAYVNEENGLPDVAAVLSGVSDIIAEDISTTAEYRQMLRTYLSGDGAIKAAAAKEEDSVYADYYEYSEPITKMRPHRILALNRGEKEGYLKVDLAADETVAVGKLCATCTKNPASPVAPFIHAAATDSYSRLIFPSLEREIRAELFDAAAEGALKVFGENLKNLLLIAPVKGKTVLGFDPGYAHGCKLAVVDKTGKYLTSTVIYPTKPREDTARASRTLLDLIRKYKVDIIAIGNGTASKESEIFIAGLLKEIPEDVKYIVVSEAGASIYSASKLAAEEFPEFDVMQRSAVSIARRLQDPLAELIKIDPKGIGVGQYQHDMKQARLDEALGGVVEDCVNKVGVDVNTASYSLLSYISGINITSAKNIVKYREENGEFTSRAQLLKVPRIGAKAYEQAAGFLRVPGGKEILDNTGVHPESYAATAELLTMFELTKEDVANGSIGKTLGDKVRKAGVVKVCEKLGIGEPTLFDILNELEKPGRDIRDALPPPILRDDILSLEDLKPDMELTGTVRNVIDFGAFVDIGVHQDGLVHISQLCDRFVKHPSEVVKVGDIVTVRVLSVDVPKKRIALTMRSKSKA